MYLLSQVDRGLQVPVYLRYKEDEKDEKEGKEEEPYLGEVREVSKVSEAYSNTADFPGITYFQDRQL